MNILYIQEQGAGVSVAGECLVMRAREGEQQVRIPLLEGVLVFGIAQVTMQAIRACLQHRIPIVYLSRSGYCYGRTLPMGWPIERLGSRQRELSQDWQLQTARQMVRAKVLNGRVLLMRQARRREGVELELAVRSMGYLAQRLEGAMTLDQVRGLEGAAAGVYFPALGSCLKPPFVFGTRTRRPPTNPVNALLSFGYQLLWSHLLLVVELQGLDPYQGVLHTAHHGHAALVSDLLEEFRAPIVDSLVLWLINTGTVDIERDFEYRNGGCFLNESGRKQFLRSFVGRMSEKIGLESDVGDVPRWGLLGQQAKRFRQAVKNPTVVYQPYRID